jgi:pantoate--beta-alanine ligase
MGKKMVEDGLKNVDELITAMKKNIETEELARIDYVEVVDFNTITKLDEIKGDVLVAMAVYIGKTRLIDNFIIEV